MPSNSKNIMPLDDLLSIPKSLIKEWQTSLLHWYKANRRELPWRGEKDPYKVWVSEIILQQTQVKQGYDYYLRFIKRFPDYKALALATEDEVLQEWQGLGYYSRARNMHAAAKQILSLGSFPTSYEDIRQLKGIGNYTAAAIASMVFHLPHAVVDGNVYRLLARYWGIDSPIDTSAGQKRFQQLASLLLANNCPGDYNQAMMDFGATQCTAAAPLCTTCPFANGCFALREERIATLPFKAKKTKVRKRYFVYIYLRYEESNQCFTFLRKRKKGDIWQGLYEPLLLAFDGQKSFPEIVSAANLPQGSSWRELATDVKHLLSHQELHASFYEVELTSKPLLSNEFIQIKDDERSEYAVPRLVELLYDKLT